MANPTLSNGSFAQNTQNQATGWTTNGTVTFGAAGAELRETLNTQAALRQVFSLGEHDRYLRFTVQSDLHSTSNGPGDAFEAALLDANTGAALRSMNGLSRSDAFLNQQAPGAHALLNTSAALVVTENLDGSRTYTLDLAGLSAGSALELSLDLIGFGEADSAVRISNVQLLPDLEALDDSTSGLEDEPLTINVRANDQLGTSTEVQTLLIAAPAHGTASLNSDGSFTYTSDERQVESTTLSGS